MTLRTRAGFYLSIFLILGAPLTSSFAQLLYKQTANSYIAISGTSTLNAWTMTSKDAKCTASFELNSDEIPTKLLSLQFSMRSESLKSGHKAMDKNAYATLNSEDHKLISFELTSATITDAKIHFTGNLTMAGITKQISTQAVYKILPDHSLFFTGSKNFLMSDYKIDAPTFMFGTVTTGNEINVSFNINLVPVKKKN